MKTFIAAIVGLALLASCSTTQEEAIQADVAKAQTFAASPDGQILIAGVQAASSAFAPEYAGVIGVGLSSLETGKMPTASALANTIASVTGSSATSSKVAGIVSAVAGAINAAPTPNAGLVAAAAAVNAASAK